MHGLPLSPSSDVIGYYPPSRLQKVARVRLNPGVALIQKSITALTHTSVLPVQSKPQEILRYCEGGSDRALFFCNPGNSVFLSDECYSRRKYKWQIEVIFGFPRLSDYWDKAAKPRWRPRSLLELWLIWSEPQLCFSAPSRVLSFLHNNPSSCCHIFAQT